MTEESGVSLVVRIVPSAEIGGKLLLLHFAGASTTTLHRIIPTLLSPMTSMNLDVRKLLLTHIYIYIQILRVHRFYC